MPAAVAREILSGGFRNTTSSYPTRFPHWGVWLTNVLLDADEGAIGDTILEVTIDSETRVARYESIEDCKRYREWFIPPDLINDYGHVRQITEDEAAEAKHWVLYEARLAAEHATAEMFHNQERQEAEEAWEAEQTVSLDELLDNEKI